MLCVSVELTANRDSDGVLHQVGAGHHHAGEGLLVAERGLSDEQVVLVVDADPLGVIVGGLNGGLVALGLFDQQISRSAVGFLLKCDGSEEKEKSAPRHLSSSWFS